jgi:hypothetical protein
LFVPHDIEVAAKGPRAFVSGLIGPNRCRSSLVLRSAARAALDLKGA